MELTAIMERKTSKKLPVHNQDDMADWDYSSILILSLNVDKKVLVWYNAV